MGSILDIINELNVENGSNYKLSVLKKYTDNELLKRVLQMTHDRVRFTYGLSIKHWNETEKNTEIFETYKRDVKYTLEQVLDFMSDELATQNVTGNDAIAKMHEYFTGLSIDDLTVATRVLNRDLRINVGRTQINKVFPNLIVKPVYMRCGIFGPKTAKDIRFPAYIQVKADGTYREACVSGGIVSFISRSGESYEYPVLDTAFMECPDGYYVGELIVRGTENRSESNGLINSDNPPHDLIDFHVWDYITVSEYNNAHSKIANITTYEERFAKLKDIVQTNLKGSNIHLIENHEVSTVDEALAFTSNWMDQGLEGGILKDKSSVFKDGTSKHQLKLKLEIDVECRVVGFQEGTPGTAREKTFGAILFTTDDDKIKGRASGFTDAQLTDFNLRREEMIGKIITIRCNDITRGRNNEHYALSHPRFIEVREDRVETDTLERALVTKDMAKGLK